MVYDEYKTNEPTTIATINSVNGLRKNQKKKIRNKIVWKKEKKNYQESTTTTAAAPMARAIPTTKRTNEIDLNLNVLARNSIN